MAISFSSVLGSAADLGAWPNGGSIGIGTITAGPGTPASPAHPTAGSAIPNNRLDCAKAGGDWRYFGQKCDIGG